MGTGAALLMRTLGARSAINLEKNVLMAKNAVVANVTQGEFLLLHWVAHEYQDHLEN